MYIMGIDMGTSGCKAVVFDENWEIAGQAYREYALHFPAEGLLELDPETVWANMKEVIREANEKTGGRSEALAVSAIGDVIIATGADGVSIRDSIIDFDPRGGPQITAFVERFGLKRFYETTGMPPLYIGSLSKILWIRENEPEVFARTARWASYEDYIVGRLGMEPTVSFSECSRTMLFDIRKKQWASEILEAAGLSENQMPKAVPSGTRIGNLPDPVREDLGFSQDCCVYAGGHDMVCAATGSGLDDEDTETAVDIAGTIEGLVLSMKDVNTGSVMLENLLPCYLGFSGYVTFSVNLTAGSIMRWLRDNIEPDIYQQAKTEGRNYFTRALVQMDPAEPGSVLLIPHFSGSGNPSFNPEAKGVLYGLTLDTGRDAIGRAVAEALAYELRLHLELYRQAGIEVRKLRAVGGGSSLDRQLQLKANITGVPVIKGAITESSALGAAAYAAYGAGILSNPAEAYGKDRTEEKVFYPDEAAYARFSEKYREYKALSLAIQHMEETMK